MPVVGWLAALLLAPSAAFARQPLVIVAEATADAGITAAEIRKAVTAELGEDAAEPSGENATASDVLFIATNARRAVLAFCPNNPNDGEVRRRTIELPDDSNDRKKTIAWIALNLVRNQVADLGGIEPSPHPTEPPAQKPAPALPANQGSPPPASQPSEDAHSASAPTVQAELDDHAPSPWRVAAFAGYSMHFIGSDFHSNWGWAPWRGGTEWQVELTKRMAGWTVGAALDAGDQDLPAFGIAAIVGDEWRRGKLGLEATAGLGLELTRRETYNIEVVASSTTGQSSTATISHDLRPRIYGRGNASLVWHSGRETDLLLRLALHVETDDRVYTYATALLGLRLTLP